MMAAVQERIVCEMCEAYMADAECELKETCPAAGLKEAEDTIKQQKKELKEKNEEIRKLKAQVSDLRWKQSYMIDPNAIGDRHEMGG